MNKQAYISYLKELVNQNEELQFTNLDEVIYIIEDLHLGGGFHKGKRSIDHWVLLDKGLVAQGVTWENVLNWGVLVVPETKLYVSNAVYTPLDMLGYSPLPVDSNPIVGFKEEDYEYHCL